MQDLSSTLKTTMFPTMEPPPLPEQEKLRCPRCESMNTKFCYYNNYNLSQPRHFCKSCRRYWTKGGSLRNIPIGGATRKTATKSSSPTAKRLPPSSAATPQVAPKAELVGGFSSMLASNGQFGNFIGHAGGGGGCWGSGSGGSSSVHGWPDLTIFTNGSRLK